MTTTQGQGQYPPGVHNIFRGAKSNSNHMITHALHTEPPPALTQTLYSTKLCQITLVCAWGNKADPADCALAWPAAAAVAAAQFTCAEPCRPLWQLLIAATSLCRLPAQTQPCPTRTLDHRLGPSQKPASHSCSGDVDRCGVIMQAHAASIIIIITIIIIQQAHLNCRSMQQFA